MGRLTREEFVRRAEERRSDLDYAMVHYDGMRKKIIVKCKTCRTRVSTYPRHVLNNHRVDCDCHRENNRGFGKRHFQE